MLATRAGLSLIVVATMMVIAALVLAGCSDDDGNEATDDVATPTTQPVGATPTAGETPAPERAETPEADEPDPAPTPTTETGPTATPVEDDDGDVDDADDFTVLVYLVRGEEIGVASRSIAPTPEIATGSINELLTGTTGYEEDLGFHSEIPLETRLLGISIDDGLAIVDLSGDFESGGGSFSMQMRVAQIVFTMTQFDTVDEVQIRINGRDVESIGGEGVLVDQPMSREDFEDLSPAILVESPTPGEIVSSPLRLTGTAMTFEATIQIEIVDNSGQIIYEDFATAEVGTGFRGPFDLTIPFELTREGFGAVIVYEESARDGSRINLIEIPVDFRH
jgi:germination protein M